MPESPILPPSPGFRRAEKPPVSAARSLQEFSGKICRVISLQPGILTQDKDIRIAPSVGGADPAYGSGMIQQNPLPFRIAVGTARIAALLLALASSLTASQSVTIAWSANPESNIAGYKVYAGTKSGSYTTIVGVTGSTSVVLPGLVASTTYYCVVQAVNSSGQTSDLSDEVSFATRPAVPEITVLNASGSALSDGISTIPYASTSVGSSDAVRTLTISNTGDGDLTGLSISMDGIHAADFSASPPAVVTLAPGAATTFTIVFKPNAEGFRKASIHIASNDADESSFDIALSGSGIAANSLFSAWADTAGLAGASAQSTAVPFNDGVPNLVKFAFNLNPSAPDVHTLVPGTGTSGLPHFSIERSGPQTWFRVEFLRRKGSGLVYLPEISADLRIYRPMSGAITVAWIDDIWERVVLRKSIDSTSPALFGRVGVAMSEISVTPDISVSLATGTILSDGASMVRFPAAALGNSEFAQTLVLANLGTGFLTGLAVSVDGLNGQDFSVGYSGPAVLEPDASADLTVTFRPSASGLRTAVLHIASNDPDEAPFEIALSGTGMMAEGMFGNWAASAGLNGSAALPNATPFNDGVPNLLKYAFNLKPSAPDTRVLTSGTSSGLPVYSVVKNGSQTWFRLEFLRRKGSNLTYTPKVSSDLVNFSLMSGTTTVTAIDEIWERAVIMSPCDSATTPKLFGRVDVTLP